MKSIELARANELEKFLCRDDTHLCAIAKAKQEGKSYCRIYIDGKDKFTLFRHLKSNGYRIPFLSDKRNYLEVYWKND